MSDPVNITINVSDTVPLSLYKKLEETHFRARRQLMDIDQTAAELRIEVAALTVALDAYKATEEKSKKEAIRKEQEIHRLLQKIADMTHTINQLKSRSGN